MFVMFREISEGYLILQIFLNCKYFASFWFDFVAELSATVIFFYLLLSGDVELNPGPRTSKDCLLSIS